MLKIYIANLGKYNEGELVGKWVELPYAMPKVRATKIIYNTKSLCNQNHM